MYDFYLAKFVGSFQDAGLEFDVGDVAVDRVADAEQFVCVQDDKLGVGHKHFGRLVVFDGQNESVDGVAQVDDVRLGLAAVKFHHVAIVITDDLLRSETAHINK